MGLNKPLTYDNGRLRLVKELVKTLGKERLLDLGFVICRATIMETFVSALSELL